MSVEQLIVEPPDKTWYGCSTKFCFEIGALIPIQRVGLAPFRVFDRCGEHGCYVIPTFASASGDCGNDKASYLFDFPSPSGNDFRLEKYNYATETWVDVGFAPSFGTNFPFGVFGSYPNRTGFVLEWQNVLNSLGGGTYRFTLTPTIQPDPLNPIMLRSYTYFLQPYSPNAADNTVVVETSFGGKIDNLLYNSDSSASPHDLYDMIWDDYARYFGTFGRFNPTYRDSYVKRRNNQNLLNKAYVDGKFILELTACDVEMYRRISTYGSKSDVKITDYHLLNGYKYQQERVFIESATATQAAKTPITTATLTCASRFDIKFDRK